MREGRGRVSIANKRRRSQVRVGKKKKKIFPYSEMWQTVAVRGRKGGRATNDGRNSSV
jgi:hypothetical protein